MSTINDFVRHRFDAVKSLLESKLQETIGHRLHHFASTSATDSADSSTSSHDNENSVEFSLLSHLESLLVELQSLLVWNNPTNSASALTFFTVFYWLIVWLHPSLVSSIALVAFCYHFYEMWIRHVWPAIRVPELAQEEIERWTKLNINTLSAPEIEYYVERAKLAFVAAYERLLTMRAESRGKFCGVSVSCFAIVYFLARNIPGHLLVYSLAITICLTPGILLHVLPKEYLDMILDFCLADSSSTPSSLSPSPTSSSSTSSFASLSSAPTTAAISLSSVPTSATATSESLVPSVTSVFSTVVAQVVDVVSAPVSSSQNQDSDTISGERVPAVHLPEENVPETEVCRAEPTPQALLTEQLASMQSSGETEKSLPRTNDETDDDEDECMVKSNYCENFFTLDRQPTPTRLEVLSGEESTGNLSRLNETEHENVPATISTSAIWAGKKPETTATATLTYEDTVGDDFEIISDSELEPFTSN